MPTLIRRDYAFENATLVGVSIAGLVAFGFPFILSALLDERTEVPSRSVEASLLLALVVGAALVAATGELVRGPERDSLSRSVALLAALVAIDATLRLVPSFFGASPIFALMVLVGYSLGSRFGFAMGALTLFLSAAITAGIGPWLPFQMLCAGWVGAIAGWLPHPRRHWAQLTTVIAFGAIAGFGYGALMNLYAWPFAAPGTTSDVGLYWSPTLSLSESLDRYATFYFATSFVHDTTRALANAVLILVVGAPILRLLDRFRQRTTWSATASS